MSRRVWPLVGSALATAITLFYLRRYAKQGATSELFGNLKREGVQYFAVIVVVNAIVRPLCLLRSLRRTSDSSPVTFRRKACARPGHSGTFAVFLSAR